VTEPQPLKSIIRSDDDRMLDSIGDHIAASNGMLVTSMMRHVLILSLLTTDAWAHDWTSHKWSHITDRQRSCIGTLHSRAGYPCCNGDDVDKIAPNWNFGSNSYVVELTNPKTGETRPYQVPQWAEVVNDHCGVSSAMVWWSPNYNADGTMWPTIFCFKPGQGG
jgi:hypothetical protein